MILIVMLPHIPRLPPWVVMWCLGFWSYAILARRYHWPHPPQNLLRILTILGFAGVLFTYRYTLNVEASVGLLATMAGIKPLEIRAYKDRMFMVLYNIFLCDRQSQLRHIPDCSCVHVSVRTDYHNGFNPHQPFQGATDTATATNSHHHGPGTSDNAHPVFPVSTITRESGRTAG